MSLQDRYYRDEGRIQRMDRRCTEIANQVGEFWMDQTGLQRTTLTRGLYLVAIAAAFQHFTLYRDPGMLVLIGIAAIGYRGYGNSRGGIVEQLQSEVAGLPKNAIAFMRLFILMLGLYSLTVGITKVVATELSLDAVVSGVGGHLLGGLAFVAYQTSEYVRRTNPTSGNGRRPGKLVRRTASS